VHYATIEEIPTGEVVMAGFFLSINTPQLSCLILELRLLL